MCIRDRGIQITATVQIPENLEGYHKLVIYEKFSDKKHVWFSITAGELDKKRGDFKGTRKQIDKMCAEVEVISGQKAYWFKMDENGELAGGIAKFLQEKKDAVIEALGLKNGELIGQFFCKGKQSPCAGA